MKIINKLLLAIFLTSGIILFTNITFAKKVWHSKNYSLEPYIITQGVTDKKLVALTFDCGSGKGDFDKIVDFLIKQNIPATFFITGMWIKNYPQDAKKLSSPLFNLGNHLYSHLHMRNLSEQKIIAELNDTEILALKIIGKTTKPFFSPPYSEYNFDLVNILKSKGYAFSLLTEIVTKKSEISKKEININLQ